MEVRRYSVTGAWDKEVRKKKNKLMTYFSVSSLYSPILQEKSTICDNTCKEKEKKLSRH